MNNNFMNNDADFEQFVNSTLNYNNSRNNTQNIYVQQITSILGNSNNQLLFTKLFANYFTNRALTKDYQYASDCCICMDTSNYCIKICNCSEIKYCFKCFKEYVKTSILADPIKINSVINSCRANEPYLDLPELVSCSICRKAPMLELIKSMITTTFQDTPTNTSDIGSYLHSLDFFSETMPKNGEPKWYLLFNQNRRIRYNLVPLELLETLNNNSTTNHGNHPNDNDETKLRKAGLIYIFEINQPTYTEHKQILDILKQSENQTTNRVKTELLRYNQSRLIML